MSVFKLLFHNRVGSKETVLKNRAVLTLIVAVVFCGFLTVLLSSQGDVFATEIKTETVPSGYFRLTVSPAEVCASVGEQIEIRCTIYPLINTPIEVSSVDVVLFDSYDSIIREQAMTMDSYWSANTEYTITGDEAYYKLKVTFTFPLGESGEYTEHGAHAFPIVVNQE